MKKYTLIFLAIFCLGGNLKSQNNRSIRPFESTITFKMLQLDAEIIPNNSKEIRLCKALVEKAVTRIKKKYTETAIKTANEKVAINVLQMIDSTFTEFDFLFSTNSKDAHFDFLTLAFRDMFSNTLNFRNNIYRKNYWNRRGTQIHRLIDCDEYSRIYAGIAEMINLPLTVVHIPDHYYIRWHFSPSKYLCWNPNDGKAYFDESTMECYAKWEEFSKRHGSKTLPPDLNSKELLSNYLMLRGDIYFLNETYKNISRAKRDYETALKSVTNDPDLFNNYVWISIMYPESDKSLNTKQLHSYIDKAIRSEKNLNFYDAKACLFAFTGDFKNAIKTEEEGLKLKYDPYYKRSKAERHLECFRRGEVCKTLN